MWKIYNKMYKNWLQKSRLPWCPVVWVAAPSLPPPPSPPPAGWQALPSASQPSPSAPCTLWSGALSLTPSVGIAPTVQSTLQGKGIFNPQLHPYIAFCPHLHLLIVFYASFLHLMSLHFLWLAKLSAFLMFSRRWKRWFTLWEPLPRISSCRGRIGGRNKGVVWKKSVVAAGIGWFIWPYKIMGALQFSFWLLSFNTS